MPFLSSSPKISDIPKIGITSNFMLTLLHQNIFKRIFSTLEDKKICFLKFRFSGLNRL